MVDDITDPSIWEPQISSLGEGMWRKLLQLLGWVFQNSSFSKWDIPNLPKIVAFHIFHISVFVNTTFKVVNTYAILYMCMDIIICHSDRSPWKGDDISDPWHGRTSNQLRWEKECGGNSCNFCGEFFKTLPSQNGIFPTFQNSDILHLLHFCICQYYSNDSE